MGWIHTTTSVGRVSVAEMERYGCMHPAYYAVSIYNVYEQRTSMMCSSVQIDSTKMM